MKVSYKYIKERLHLDATPEEIADKLTFAGAEVEGIEPLGQGTNLVIGHILSCVPHPDSDHLHILQVDEGPFGVHQIVCGAPNARVGLKVIVARTGAKLRGGEIKPSKIRGVDSDGMCCSLLELGVEGKYLSEKQTSGIEELDESAPVGESNVLGYLGLDDVAIDISVLPNRPDLYAFENVVKEVACLFDIEQRKEETKELPLNATSFKVGSETSSCKIFSARVIKGVETHASPLWLSRLLEVSGIRSINNIVDIGNYIMLLTGQPLNMYDLDKLPKQELIVRDDLEGEFLAMDGNKYPLQKGDLVVTSDGQPMCLAGIMTADACRVDENTKNIVVEAASFHFASIRHTSNRIGLASDSSLRFCKGINPDQMEDVQRKTSEILSEIAGAKEIEETALYDVYAHEKKEIRTSVAYLNGRLGTSFDTDLILKTLARDNLSPRIEGEELVCEVPSYRLDMDGEADISEELIRILGYDKIVSTLPITQLALRGLTPKQEKKKAIRDYLLAQGLYEVVTYTLVSKDQLGSFRYLNNHEALKLKNPLTVDREFVRPSLLPSLLKVATYNVARQNKDFGIFEVSDIDASDFQGQYLSFVLTGNAKGQGRLGERPYDFFDAKGYAEAILKILGVKEGRYRFMPWSLGGDEMHPGRSAEIRLGKQLVGYFGEVHPVALKKNDLKSAIVLELDFDALASLNATPIKVAVPAKYPSVSRDLSVVLAKDVAFDDVRRSLMKCSPLVRSVEAFDVYTGLGVVEGKKSLALSLTLGSEDHTLQEGEIQEAMKKAMDALKLSFNGEIRGV